MTRKLSDEIAAYQGMASRLETDHLGKWAVVAEGRLVGVHDSFEEAADEAVAQFGRGPYLIRQVGVHPPPLPASVLYRPLPVRGVAEDA